MCDGFETREQTRLVVDENTGHGVLWHSEGRHKSALLSQVPAPPPLLILTCSAVLLTHMFDGKERNKFWSEIADPSTPNMQDRLTPMSSNTTSRHEQTARQRMPSVGPQAVSAFISSRRQELRLILS